MQRPIWPIVIARREYAKDLTLDKLVSLAGPDPFTTRTATSSLGGAKEAQDDTELGFCNVLAALAEQKKVPAFDRSLLRAELFRRKEHSILKRDLRRRKCNLERLRDFLVLTGCPSLDPANQLSWEAKSTASYARYFNGDLLTEAVKLAPGFVGTENFWLGSEMNCLSICAKWHRDSWRGFHLAAADANSSPGFEQHIECANLLFKSMANLNVVELVGVAIHAEEKEWSIPKGDKDGIPTLEDAGNLLREAVPSRSECVVLANKLCHLFEGDSWKARIRCNEAHTLIAMLSISGVGRTERGNIEQELLQLFPKLNVEDRVQLIALPTTRRALRQGVSPTMRKQLEAHDNGQRS